jgi:lactoylglutathione lyase
VSGSAERGGGAARGGVLGDRPAFGLSEIILIVKDVARSVAFYRDVVGLVPDNVSHPTFAWFWTGPEGRTQRLGLTLGPLSYGAAHCGGAQHFAFGVAASRIPELKVALEAKGVPVEGPIEFKFWNARSIYFSDPDGHRLEFCGFERPAP